MRAQEAMKPRFEKGSHSCVRNFKKNSPAHFAPRSSRAMILGDTIHTVLRASGQKDLNNPSRTHTAHAKLPIVLAPPPPKAPKQKFNSYIPAKG